METIFSDAEQRVILALKLKRLTIDELSKEVYYRKKKPLNPRNVVAGLVRRINLKCKYHQLEWFINGQGIGRGGKTVWRDKNV